MIFCSYPPSLQSKPGLSCCGAELYWPGLAQKFPLRREKFWMYVTT